MELELRDIFRIIWARIWIIVLITIVAMLASGIISYFYLDKIYESSTTLIVNKQKDDNEKETQYTYNDILLSQKLVSTYTEIAKSSYVLERVIKELNLDLSPDELKNDRRFGGWGYADYPHYRIGCLPGQGNGDR